MVKLRHEDSSESCCLGVMGRVSVSALAMILSIVSTPAVAHRLNIFVYPEGDRINLESYFSGGAPCQDSQVKVLNKEGEVVADGKTDTEGKWSFNPGSSTGLKVVVEAGEGHRAEYRLTADDYPEGLAENLAEEATASAPVAAETGTETFPAQTAPGGAALSATEVEHIVDKVLERKLAPIRRSMAKAAIHEPGFTEILGGIGYIIGLFGLGAYFMARSKSKNGN